MKITLRLIFSLLFVAALVSGTFSFIQVTNERGRLAEDLEHRATIFSETLQDSVRNALRANHPSDLKRLVKRFSNRERLLGMAVYDNQGKILESSPDLRIGSQEFPQVMEAINENHEASGFRAVEGKKMHIYAVPVQDESKVIGALAVFHNVSYIDARLKNIWISNFYRFMILSTLLILTTIIVVRWSITGPIADFAEWLRSLRTGSINKPIALRRVDILEPLAAEVAQIAKTLAAAKKSAVAKTASHVEDSFWTAEKLKDFVRHEIGDKTLFVVSNREPYMHVKKGGATHVVVPAGGVVTALEPIMRACGGVWIAHGSGNADMENTGKNGKLAVPPGERLYTLKRVWLTKKEEEGYYYGFSNEGLWPLCHITHTRPVFRLDDWVYYQEVNQKFADSLLDEISGEENPLVLVQDYQFSLLPLLIKSKRPDARVGIFWHIPWPNPEVFGICPWKEEILLGLLGADFIGFQTQYYCNNFLETVDRFLESKVDWEHFSVERQSQRTFVKQFPISVAFPPARKPISHSERTELLKRINVNARHIAMGVDRIDYTKGIIERFRAVERFLVKYPEYIGNFTFIELGAPSRTLIKRYYDLMKEVEETADKINWKFQTIEWKPIVLLIDHHVHDEIEKYYRAADVCMVTSLHDGMNLVAKEFVVSRDDEGGVLILSQFTGAARELRDAISVNPYDIEDMADSIYQALTMSAPERTERMRNLRETVREKNIYLWAADLVSALSRVRLPKNSEERTHAT